MRIGIDIDGVIENIYEAIISHVKTNYGLDISGFDSFDMGVRDGKIPPEVEDIFDDVRFYENMELMPDAVKSIKRLAQYGDEIYFVTARPKHLFEHTFAQFTRLFKFPFALSFTRNKAAAAENYKLDYFIEDNLSNAKTVATKCEGVFLMDASYNQGELLPNMRRVENWKEISSIINKED